MLKRPPIRILLADRLEAPLFARRAVAIVLATLKLEPDGFSYFHYLR